MGYVFDDLAVNVFCELYRALGSARGAYSTAFAGECYRERVFASIIIDSCGAVSEDTAV